MKVVREIFVVLGIIWVLVSILIFIVLSIPVALFTVWFKNKLFLNCMLLVASQTLSIGLFPLGFLYKIIKVLFTEETKTYHLSKYLRKVAISDDQKGNVIMGPLFNDTLITEDGHEYGNEDETISSATGRNVLKETLTTLGKRINAILSVFEEDHSVLSIEEDETN